MIEHADGALREWLTDALDVDGVDLTSGAADTAATSERARLRLQLVNVDERTEGRTVATDDVRDDSGRVLARRPATRFFALDYACSPTGEVLAGHRVLGQLLQLVISTDVVPPEFVPGELAALELPLEVGLTPPAEAAAIQDRLTLESTPVLLRAVLPMQPAADTEIGEPAQHLHLDVGPPPEGSRAGTRAASAGADGATDVLLADRRWTTVRRREFIGGQVAPDGDTPVATAVDAAAAPASRSTKRSRKSAG